MKHRIFAVSIMALAALAAGCTATQAPSVQTDAASADRPWMDRKLSPDARATAIVARMTTDEKLTLVFGYFGTDFSYKNYKAPPEARQGSAGYVPGIPRLGIPPQWQTDAGIGVASQGGALNKRGRTALPSGLATTATWHMARAYQGGEMIGREARASGFNVMLAGGVNLMREPRNGRNFEYGGEDPWLAGVMVGEQVRGIQANNLIATIKHYAINDQETDRDTGNSVIGDAEARMSDLLAFQFAIERSKPGSVMCSYNKVNGTHACENKWLLTDVLRRDWGWQGYVMSDWGATHSTASAANAGLDQDSGWPFDKEPYFGKLLAEAVAKGDVPMARLDEMAHRILRAMFAHGLFEHPVTDAPIDLPSDMLAAHGEITRVDAEEGAVLLRNEGELLPLSPMVRTIAVIGGHADKGVLAGGGSSLVYPVGGNAVPGIAPTSWPGPVMYYPNPPLDAIRRLAPHATVTFIDGKDPVAAAKLAADSDVAIVFATQWAGEAFDVSLTLADNQDGLISAVAAANRKTVVVLETGGPVLTPWAGNVGAILAAWYPGTRGGDAIANLLFGKTNPSGHLPVTFPRSLDQLAKPSAPNRGDTVYSEGATVGYKWYDAKGLEPQFPFGHGLSYTSFLLDGLTARVRDGTIEASFVVTNTGAYPGADVAQVYVAGKGWEAPKRLGGFARVNLAAGGAERSTITVDPRLLATWDSASHSWKIAAGSYEVMLGASSRDIRQRVTVTLPARTLPASWKPKG
ncbi:glycoside hydrolase family 3 C-terminal domain-containing protein [Sphingomonas sp. AOB5]|uniref:beta-glucosidase n=1 Tax=Sphingomonas sp. AOB5 TaxID=3034017 RepID=UPI0023F924DD|nr:glycoside hydrolase family 3 C-terminal domain-containing protein [Sphingomonas sp. AOB5]MDF7775638.1 glycoside hydrolase family 3 C-terminal domain-containing protein [Sphingomonas sp. AOB5]